MKYDIQPQWANIVKWYWQSVGSPGNGINPEPVWDILKQEYRAIRLYPNRHSLWSLLEFEDEQLLTAFLLKWA